MRTAQQFRKLINESKQQRSEVQLSCRRKTRRTERQQKQPRLLMINGSWLIAGYNFQIALIALPGDEITGNRTFHTAIRLMCV